MEETVGLSGSEYLAGELARREANTASKLAG